MLKSISGYGGRSFWWRMPRHLSIRTHWRKRWDAEEGYDDSVQWAQYRYKSIAAKMTRSWKLSHIWLTMKKGRYRPWQKISGVQRLAPLKTTYSHTWSGGHTIRGGSPSRVAFSGLAFWGCRCRRWWRRHSVRCRTSGLNLNWITFQNKE